jgi:hypothetical protein
MKQVRRPETRLVLRQEQLRTLDQIDLRQVAGGDPASALCPSGRIKCADI